MPLFLWLTPLSLPPPPTTCWPTDQSTRISTPVVLLESSSTLMEYSHAVLDMAYQIVAGSLRMRMDSTRERPWCRLEIVEEATTLVISLAPPMCMVLHFRDVKKTVFLPGMQSVLSAFFLGSIVDSK